MCVRLPQLTDVVPLPAYLRESHLRPRAYSETDESGSDDATVMPLAQAGPSPVDAPADDVPVSTAHVSADGPASAARRGAGALPASDEAASAAADGDVGATPQRGIGAPRQLRFDESPAGAKDASADADRGDGASTATAESDTAAGASQ